MSRWTWDQPLPGTQLFPHHRRWDCRIAIIHALRCMSYDRPAAHRMLGRACAFNAIMFDCGDPMAGRYASRIARIMSALGVGP